MDAQSGDPISFATVSIRPKALKDSTKHMNFTLTDEAGVAVLKNLCPAAIPDYIRMIFLDALIANPDRHTFNFGLMRDRSTGMLTGLAPLFDHNMALAGGGHTLAGMCIDLLEQYPACREFLPAVSEETVLHALENTGLPCDRTAVVRSVMERYRLICPEH